MRHPKIFSLGKLTPLKFSIVPYGIESSLKKVDFHKRKSQKTLMTPLIEESIRVFCGTNNVFKLNNENKTGRYLLVYKHYFGVGMSFITKVIFFHIN